MKYSLTKITFLFLLYELVITNCNGVDGKNDRTLESCSVYSEQYYKQEYLSVLSSSSSNTIQTTVQNNDTINRPLSQLVNHFERTSIAVYNFPCTLFLENGESQRQSAAALIEYIGLGKTYTLPRGRFCITELDSTEEDGKQFVSSIKEIMDSLLDNALSIVQNYKTNWVEIFPTSFLKFDTTSGFIQCDLTSLMAYHSNGTWAVGIEFTNATINTKESTREFFREYVPSNGSFNLRLQRCSDNGEILQETFGTALGEISRYGVSWSHMAGARLESNPALQKALESRGINFAVEVVQDIDSPAVTAILFLPALLNFFPLSLFLDTGVGTTFMYTVLTDVLSIVPIFIRGIELYLYGRRRSSSFVSWVYGDIHRGNPGAVESWFASCKVDKRVRVWGIAFIFLSSFIMVIGISLEFISRSKLEKMKAQWKEKFGFESRETGGLLWYTSNLKKEKV